MLRPIYILLLHLHPRFFRDQFAGEMLWIFDQNAASRRPALLLDALQSLTVQWMLRSEFDETQVPTPADRVPAFYTIGSEIPPAGALLNGVLGSIIVFALACIALAHSAGHGRVYTYYGSDFHAGPPTYGDVPANQPAQSSGPPAPGLLARFAAVLRKSPPTPPNSQTGQASPASLPMAVGPGVPTPPKAILYFKVVPVLAALDTDHDGELSAQEIDNAPTVLATLDQNHDGSLDAEEAGRHPLRNPPTYSFESLMKYDRNGDGKLQRSEVPGNMRGVFIEFDTNHDGVLSQKEVHNLVDRLNSPRQAKLRLKADRLARIEFMRMEPVLGVLDADHDGAISAIEIRNAPAALRTLDRNHDGRLTFDELSRTPLETEVAIIFRLDTNFDGKISRLERENEFGRHIAALLDDADRDGDGYVTWDELTREIQRRADLNHDGEVTWEELMRARRSGALYGPPPVGRP
jgi:Ca2+-binding EF-hand superfamily protein